MAPPAWNAGLQTGTRGAPHRARRDADRPHDAYGLEWRPPVGTRAEGPQGAPRRTSRWRKDPGREQPLPTVASADCAHDRARDQFVFVTRRPKATTRAAIKRA